MWEAGWAIPFNYYIWLCYIWVGEIQRISEQNTGMFHSGFQHKNTSAMTWWDRQKIKSNIIRGDKKLQTKIIVCLHVCACVCLSIPEPKEWKNECWVQTKKIEGKKTAESRWADLLWRYWQIYRQKIGCISDTILDIIWSLTSIQMVSHFWPPMQLLLFLNICPTMVSHLARGGYQLNAVISAAQLSVSTDCVASSWIWVTSFGWAATATR